MVAFVVFIPERQEVLAKPSMTRDDTCVSPYCEVADAEAYEPGTSGTPL